MSGIHSGHYPLRRVSRGAWRTDKPRQRLGGRRDRRWVETSAVGSSECIVGEESLNPRVGGSERSLVSLSKGGRERVKRCSDGSWTLAFGMKSNLPSPTVYSGERLPEISSWLTRVLRSSAVVREDIFLEKGHAFLGGSTNFTVLGSLSHELNRITAPASPTNSTLSTFHGPTRILPAPIPERRQHNANRKFTSILFGLRFPSFSLIPWVFTSVLTSS